MSTKIKVDYTSAFKFCVPASILMVIVFSVMFFQKGLNYGVDFRGGAEIQVRFLETVDVEGIRSVLASANVPVSTIQKIGDESKEILLKVQSDKEDLNKASADVERVLGERYGAQNLEILKNDIVGPKAGAQLRTSGFQAMAWAILAIMIYIGLRFDYKFAPGAIIALLHDVLFVVGIFILTQKEFSLQIVAALLAVIGYSVNDTVVIFDRVREQEAANPHEPIKSVINRSLNETMSRTILTTATTFIVTLVMFVFGGGAIQDFFFALCVGALSGTYSTIFIASPITIFLDRFTRSTEVGVKAKA